MDEAAVTDDDDEADDPDADGEDDIDEEAHETNDATSPRVHRGDAVQDLDDSDSVDIDCTRARRGRRAVAGAAAKASNGTGRGGDDDTEGAPAEVRPLLRGSKSKRTRASDAADSDADDEGIARPPQQHRTQPKPRSASTPRSSTAGLATGSASTVTQVSASPNAFSGGPASTSSRRSVATAPPAVREMMTASSSSSGVPLIAFDRGGMAEPRLVATGESGSA